MSEPQAVRVALAQAEPVFLDLQASPIRPTSSIENQ